LLGEKQQNNGLAAGAIGYPARDPLLRSPVAMQTSPRKPSSSPFGSLVSFFVKRRPFEHETSLYILVSVLDFYMTWWMLNRGAEGGFQFVESNPVARFFIEHWGLRGLFGFKITAVVAVLLATVLIAERRPAAARAILWIGILVTGFVVAYSFAMYARHTGLV
jgi:hypothetical protein